MIEQLAMRDRARYHVKMIINVFTRGSVGTPILTREQVEKVVMQVLNVEESSPVQMPLHIPVVVIVPIIIAKMNVSPVLSLLSNAHGGDEAR